MKVLKIVAIILLVISFFASTVWLVKLEERNQPYVDSRNCHLFMSYPEKYIDKIPTDCLPQYFEGR